MFGDAPERLVAVGWTLPEKTTAFFYGSEVAQWSRWCERAVARKQDCYMGVYLLRQDDRKRLKTGRGKLEDVAGVVGMWLDLDTKPGGFESKDRALGWLAEAAEALGLEPSWIVDSGHGLQPFWKAEPALLTPSQVLREDAAEGAARWTEMWQAKAPAGVRIDPCKDLTRVLRIAGTTNFKEEPVKTSLILL